MLQRLAARGCVCNCRDKDLCATHARGRCRRAAVGRSSITCHFLVYNAMPSLTGEENRQLHGISCRMSRVPPLHSVWERGRLLFHVPRPHKRGHGKSHQDNCMLQACLCCLRARDGPSRAARRPHPSWSGRRGAGWPGTFSPYK